jgi:hypothetical protein
MDQQKDVVVFEFDRKKLKADLSYTGRSKSRAHHTKQLYFADLMHKLQDIEHLLLMFITLHLRNAASLASVKMAGLPISSYLKLINIPEIG